MIGYLLVRLSIFFIILGLLVVFGCFAWLAVLLVYFGVLFDNGLVCVVLVWLFVFLGLLITMF